MGRNLEGRGPRLKRVILCWGWVAKIAEPRTDLKANGPAVQCRGKSLACFQGWIPGEVMGLVTEIIESEEQPVRREK